MITEQQFNAPSSSSPLLETAWATIEAANDLGDDRAVEICRRVIDATLRGDLPAKGDIDAIFNFFD